MTIQIKYLIDYYQTIIKQQQIQQSDQQNNKYYQQIGIRILQVFIFSIIIKTGQSKEINNFYKKKNQIIHTLLQIFDIKSKEYLYEIFGRYFFNEIKENQHIEKVEFQLFFILETRLNSISNQKKLTTDQPQQKQREKIKIKSSNEQQKNNKNNQKNQKIQIKQNVSIDTALQSFQFIETQTTKDWKQFHFEEVCNYLKKLYKPLSELTYLSQHLKWTQFSVECDQKPNEKREWISKARIKLPEQIRKQSFGWLQCTRTHAAKKQSKHLASMDLLKTMYLLYPQIWIAYKHYREEKKLTIQSMPLNHKMEPVEIDLLQDIKNFQIDANKVALLYNIQENDIKIQLKKISARAELNVLQQQLTGRVSCPKPEKKLIDGKWIVLVRIQYKKDLNMGTIVTVEESQTSLNSKMAEQQGYRLALIKLYTQEKELFQKIEGIKMVKRIKNVPDEKLKKVG